MLIIELSLLFKTL